MISYKNMRAFYLGLRRWRIYYEKEGMSFDILCRAGISELLANIDRWRGII